MTSGVELDRAVLVPIVCERLATGKESLTKICESLGFKRDTFNSWCQVDPEIAKLRDAARQEWCESLEEEILDIADNTEEGTEIVERGGKMEVHTGDMLGHRKLRIDTRMRLLKAYDPYRHGDRVHQTITGPNDGPLQVADASAKLLDLLDRRAPSDPAED
jgi:hypothetical protein